MDRVNGMARVRCKAGVAELGRRGGKAENWQGLAGARTVR
jgi:hypothetical protein